MILPTPKKYTIQSREKKRIDIIKYFNKNVPRSRLNLIRLNVCAFF